MWSYDYLLIRHQPLKKTCDEVVSIAKIAGAFHDEELRKSFLDLVLQLSVSSMSIHLSVADVTTTVSLNNPSRFLLLPLS